MMLLKSRHGQCPFGNLSDQDMTHICYTRHILDPAVPRLSLVSTQVTVARSTDTASVASSLVFGSRFDCPPVRHSSSGSSQVEVLGKINFMGQEGRLGCRRGHYRHLYSVSS